MRGMHAMFVAPLFDSATITDLFTFEHRQKSSLLPRPMHSHRLRNSAGLT